MIPPEGMLIPSSESLLVLRSLSFIGTIMRTLGDETLNPSGEAFYHLGGTFIDPTSEIVDLVFRAGYESCLLGVIYYMF